MEKIFSAGGIVYHKQKILLLKKKNGDWVLPKGRLEASENPEEAAIREVKEETNIDADIQDYLGITSYTFSNYWTDYKVIHKTVSWYLMKAESFNLTPQTNEGFVQAAFIDMKEAEALTKYSDERKIIKRAIEAIK